VKFPGTGEIRVGGVREAIADPLVNRALEAERNGAFDWVKDARVNAFGDDSDLDDFHQEGLAMFELKPAKAVRYPGLKVAAVLALTLLSAMLAVGYLTGAIGNLAPLQPIFVVGGGTTAQATPTPTPTPTPEYLSQVKGEYAVAIHIDPSEESNMIGVLAVGGVGNVTGPTENGWVPIAIADLTGWVQESDVVFSQGATFEEDEEAGISATGTATTTNGANFRTGPGTGHSVIMVVPRGATVNITGPVENGWVPIEYDGQSGYMGIANLDLN